MLIGYLGAFMAKKKPSFSAKKIKPEQPRLRPPVVVVLGHVDHGKTTLLDAIRQIDSVGQEHGGITQHLGAYQIELPANKKITFIDTPGHEAFAKMRRRGADVADMAILVVAANEGVKPQTQEAFAHVQEAKIPLLIAINKIDLPNTNIKKVLRDLASHQILTEAMGGKIPALPISAKNKTGLDELLEMILLVSEVEELKNEPQKPLRAVVIEAKLSTTQGVLTTLIIKQGTVLVGQEIALDGQTNRIRAIIDDRGRFLKQAGPGSAVAILGFKQLPQVGTQISTQPEKTKLKKEKIALTSQQEKKEVSLILKADNLGSLEALKSNLPQSIKIIKTSPGPVNESDVFLAAASGSMILGLHVNVDKNILKLAEREEVLIKTYTIIYKLLEELDELITALKRQRREKILGRAEISAEFPYNQMRVLGCKVVEGRLCPQDRIRLVRKQEVIGESKIVSLRRGKEKISKAESGSDCGVLLDPPLDFMLADVVISYSKAKIKD